VAVKFVVTFENAQKTPFISGAKQRSLRGFVNFCVALMSGSYRQTVTMTVRNAAVAATGNVTFTGLPVADETVTVAGTVFTAKASASTNVQFTIGASATATGANLATVLNAHPTVSQYLTASADSGVVTITAKQPGVAGNLVTLAESATNTTVSGANLTGGSESTPFSFTL
jgi:phage tail sheath gpL-like